MSFYTSLTGLNAAATELSVTANNIANSGTTSFKRSDAQFGDIFALSNLQRASSAAGSGTVLLGVYQQFTQGNIEASSNALDLAITGDGFFPIKTSDGGEFYTRNGRFMLNESNLLVTSEGHTLQVHPLDPTTNKSQLNQATVDLEVQRELPATPTTAIDSDIKLPMDGAVIGAGIAIDPADNSTYNEAQTISLYDDAGQAYSATVYYQKTADNTATTPPLDTWEVEVFIGDSTTRAGTTTINFNSTTGALEGTIADLTIAASVPDSRANPITMSLTASSHSKAFQVVSQAQNGLAGGGLVSVDVGNDGLVTATYSNGQQLTAGRINLVNFRSPEGLRQDGETKYSSTATSGAANFGEAGAVGFGTIRSGALERSNVDLTAELIDLISSQRSFQANAKAIETSSSLTQTIINMRG